jgi:hypothetical protein
MEPDAEMLRDRARARGWMPAGNDDTTWVTSSPDGSEEAIVSAVPGGFDARVLRHQTGPSPAPEPELSHGPQIFQSCEDALDYAEANLGADGARPAV